MLKYSKELLRKIRDENVLTPLYDNEDSVCGIDLGGFAYYFQKNLQGDVIAITNSYGNVVARYTYDAWGVCTVVSDETGIIARVNPFRYRGYYYDSEIGLYYLQSRYYDPQVGRFVNGDECDNIGVSRTVCSHCLFAYCENNPINNTDKFGFFSWTIFGDIIKRIATFGEELLSSVLKNYGLSKRAYTKRTKYKKPSALLSYVYEHKSTIKNIRNNASSISSFMNVIFTIADCKAILRSDRCVVVKIADLLFYGLVRLLGYLGNKFIS